MITVPKRLISSGYISFMSPIYQGISSKNTGLGNGLLHLTSVLNAPLLQGGTKRCQRGKESIHLPNAIFLIAQAGIFRFSFIWSPQQHLRSLGYCAPLEGVQQHITILNNCQNGLVVRRLVPSLSFHIFFFSCTIYLLSTIFIWNGL